MLPFRFGPPHRQLFGLYHPGKARGNGSTAVLICNPLGQEAVRTHRMLRVLADRLARAGLHVLRFDYFGTGDAAGDDEDGDMLGWRKDIGVAHAELLKRSGCSRTVWFGARLGATLAALSAGDVPDGPQGLVLWEPVVSGRRYLEHLADRHAKALSESYSILPPGLLQARGDDEALGFGLGSALRQQLAQVDLAQSGTDAGAARFTIVTRDDDEQAAAYAAALRKQAREVTFVPFEHDFDWTSEEAINTSLVPNEALQLLGSQIEAHA